jgi:hypothetical protein
VKKWGKSQQHAYIDACSVIGFLFLSEVYTDENYNNQRELPDSQKKR